MEIALVYMVDQGGIVGRGVGYILASIPKEHNVTLFDNRQKYKEFLKSASSYDILMVSTTTLFYKEACEIIAKVDMPVLIGGVHPTVDSFAVLENRDIDYVCIGEGETFIKDFLNNYGTDELYKINNLAYKKGNKVYHNGLNPPEDLAELPLFPYNSFTKIMDGKKFLYATATRGCPFSCTYCCNSTYLNMYGKKYLRTMPIDKVIAEIKIVMNTGFRLIYFGDEMIFFDVNYAKELFKAIKSELNVSYGCMGRVESIDREMAELLRDTGCEYVSMGIECGDEEFRRKYLKRYMTNEQIINGFHLLREVGIQTTAFNMVGYPFDDDDGLAEITDKFNEIVNPNYSQVTWYYPFPGTEMYNYCIEHNLISDKSIKAYSEGSILKGFESKVSKFKSRGAIN